jgi:peptidoglycan hydrolase-like protein with peptidoglycan-binding domain
MMRRKSAPALFDEGDELHETGRHDKDYLRWVQQALNQVLGLRLQVDGVRGTQTRSAIRSFQAQRGLTVDGDVGTATAAALVQAGAPPPPSPASASTPSSGGGGHPEVDTVLPRSGPGFYSYHPGSPGRQVARPETIRALQAIGAAWAAAHPGGPRIGIGDISFRGGGPMKPHKSHQLGVDADLRILRSDGAEKAATYHDAAYSRTLTQALVDTIRANAVLPVKTIYFNDPAVRGVSKWPGHDNHLHVRFVAPSAPGRSAPPPPPPKAPSPFPMPATPAPPPPGRARDPILAKAIGFWSKPTGVADAPTFHELVERWRPRHLPLPLLVAFSALEAHGYDDATHGTEKNHWSRPVFYELGMFQTPAGLHGVCTSGRYADCAHRPPGDDPRRESAWFKIAHDLGLDPLRWTDPTVQVRIGLANLERDAATVRRLYPDLFPDPASDWALRASVLMPFGPGIGYTLKLLKEHRAGLRALPEAQRWAALRRAGATTENVDKKMALAHKLADALGVASALPPA